MNRQNSINDMRFQVIYYLNNKKLSKKDLFDCLFNLEKDYYSYYKNKNKTDIFIFLTEIYSIQASEITNYEYNPILKNIFLNKKNKKNYKKKITNVLNYFKNKKVRKIIINNYSCLLQGKRDHMEDRIVINNNNLFNFSCVLDGHGGYHCSEFLKKNIYSYFTNNLKKNYEIKKSIFISFKMLNRSFLRTYFNSGSTCNLLIINKNINKYYLANVGDSRCLAIYNNNKFKQLSIDHRPDNLKEKIRIELLGGKIIKRRVNGILGLTRAFGDKKLKVFVKPDPDIYEGKTDNIKYFLQASDGLFDFASNIEIVDFFNTALISHNYTESLNMLLKYIYTIKKSKDNISIVITTVH
jgi:serine/threonine protein phosphatase PrpC